MSDQLTLDGLGVKVTSTVKKNKVDEDIRQRLNKLMESKTQTVSVVKETSIEVIEEIIIEQTPEPEAPEVITVTDLNKNIKKLLEKSFSMIWVKGEISNFKVPGSGHMYFTLKDGGGQVKAVMFRGFAQGLKFTPEDGMEVLVRCKVTVYEPRGDYQLFCEVMEPVGYGALQVAFEKLKAQLHKEGLFDQSRKKPIPGFPQRIGIITSPTGAAIRDMINVLTRRFGGSLDVTILPTAVQGDRAPGEIAQAVRLAHKMGIGRFDVLIVGRGGGSLEDLWAFNTEEVARAIAECSIPIISAVGHEVDFTISDFVSDLRAPTPSAAAELVVKNKSDLADRVAQFHRQLVQQINKKIALSKSSSEGMSKRLIDPKRRLQDLMLRCDEWTERLTMSMDRFLEDSIIQLKYMAERLGDPQTKVEFLKQKFNRLSELLGTRTLRNIENRTAQLGRLAGMLNGLSPLAVLDRGFSIVKRQGIIVKSTSQVKSGDELEIKLAGGDLKAEVI